MTAVLHSIYDPLCGWCYGAEPLVTAATDVEGAGLTGQRFGAAYHDGLFLDPTTVLYSLPPTAAILAAQSLDADKALPTLRAIQYAHYVEGKRVVEAEVFCDLAVACGFDPDSFAAAFAAARPEIHIAETRRLMQHIGAGGFPTFVLAAGGSLFGVPHQRCAGDAARFRDWLARETAAISARSTTPQTRRAR